MDIRKSIQSCWPKVHAGLFSFVKRMVRAGLESSDSSRTQPIFFFESITEMLRRLNGRIKTEVLKSTFQKYFGGKDQDKDSFGASKGFLILGRGNRSRLQRRHSTIYCLGDLKILPSSFINPVSLDSKTATGCQCLETSKNRGLLV